MGAGNVKYSWTCYAPWPISRSCKETPDQTRAKQLEAQMKQTEKEGRLTGNFFEAVNAVLGSQASSSSKSADNSLANPKFWRSSVGGRQ